MWYFGSNGGRRFGSNREMVGDVGAPKGRFSLECDSLAEETEWEDRYGLRHEARRNRKSELNVTVTRCVRKCYKRRHHMLPAVRWITTPTSKDSSRLAHENRDV